MQSPLRPSGSRMQPQFRLVAALVLAALPALAQPADLESQITALNETVLQLEGRVRDSPQAAAAERIEAGRVLAERRTGFAQLIATGADAALRLALPDEVLHSLRTVYPELGGDLETRGSWTGELDYIVVDSEDLTSHTEVFTLIGDGPPLALHFARAPASATMSGQHIAVQGVALDQAIAVGLMSTGFAEPTVCGPTGEQKTAVLRVTFPGVTLDSTRQQALDVFFANDQISVDGYWRESSHGSTYATGEVFPTDGGAYVLDRSYTCDEYFSMGQKALQAADPDVDFRDYSRIFILFPRASGCSWAGLANVGCRTYTTADGTNPQSMAYQEEDYTANHLLGVRLSIHEGGHNLGIRHATTRDFGDDAIGDIGVPGTFNEYGDPFSSMGSWNSGHYAVPHKAYLDWLSSGTSFRTIETGGAYTVQPVVDAPTGIQALKIRRGTGNDAWVWVEYRQPDGLYESTLPSEVFAGALIHYEDPFTGLKTNLVDFTPGTFSYNDAVLAAGQSWDDPYSDLAISIGSATSSGLSVTVTYGGTGGGNCTEANPTITLSPPTQAVEGGASAAFDVSIENHDSQDCDPGIYSLSSSDPAGWTSFFGNSSLTINPGESASTTLTKIAPAGASLSTYPVDASTAKTNATSGSYSDTAQASVSVIGGASCTEADPTITLSPPAQDVDPGGTVTYDVSVQNNDSAGCDAGIYRFSSSKPSGWFSYFGDWSLTVPPGETAATTLVKVAPADASPVTEPVNASAVKQNPTQGTHWDLTEASVTVVGVSTCTEANPTVTLSPPTQDVEPGANATYTLSVQNNDSAECAAAVYNLSTAQPSGWASQFASSSLTVAPGASASTTLTKTAPAAAAPAAYPVDALAAKANPANGSYSGGAQAAANVISVPICTEANPTVTVSPSAQDVEPGSAVTYTVTLQNNDSAECSLGNYSLSSAQPSGWASQFASASLSVAPGASTSTTVTKTAPTGATPGPYPVNAAAAKTNPESGSYSGAGSASVDVVSVATCTEANPTITLSPPDQNVEPGGTATYTVSVQNNDAGACAAGSYSFSSSQPSGWISYFTDWSLTINPGETATTSLVKISPATASPATLSVNASALKQNPVSGTYWDLTEASVTVGGGGPTCTEANPTVTLSPADQNVAPGGAVTYTLTVRNNDSAECSTSSYTLASGQPSAWGTQFANTSLSVAPGATAQTTLTKTAPAGAAPSAYPVTASATKSNPQSGSYTGVGQANATVIGGGTCTEANPTITLSPPTQDVAPGGTVVYDVAVHNNDSAACPAGIYGFSSSQPSGFFSYFGTWTLTVSPGETAHTTLTKIAPASASPGTYPVNASAIKRNPENGSYWHLTSASLRVVGGAQTAAPTEAAGN